LKLDAIGIYDSKDENLISIAKTYNARCELDANKQQQQFAMDLYKSVCNGLRKSIGTKNLVGFTLSADEKVVHIFEFDKETWNNDFHCVIYGKDGPYIEVEETEEA
jgi:hypothetical protein